MKISFVHLFVCLFLRSCLACSFLLAIMIVGGGGFDSSVRFFFSSVFMLICAVLN